MNMLNRIRARRMPTPRRRVGIHFAQSSITLSVLAVDQGRLETCITQACSRDDARRILTQWVAEYDIKGLPAYVTLSRNDYDTQFVDLPGVAENELRAALPWRVTPPGVLSSNEIVATGVRLKNDREAGNTEPTLVRATIMSRSLLDQLTGAVLEAGLDLRGVYPRETALITLANQDIDASDASAPHADAPPIMTAFIGQRSTGVAIARGDHLYLSRTVTIDIDRENGIDDRQSDQLVSECVRTATNFNKRLSDRLLSKALIGPHAPGMDALRDALAEALDVEAEILAIPPNVTPADETTRATAATPEGMLAVAGTMDAGLPDNASIYQPPAKDRSLTAPDRLMTATALAVLALGLISAGQAFRLHQAEAALETARAERSDLQSQVSHLQQTLEQRREAEPSAELVARRDALQQRYNAYEQTLSAFDNVETTLTGGFADPLIALGDARVEAVWLREVTINPEQMVIRGRTLQPFQAEAFAARLEREPALNGWSARSVDIDNRTETAGGLITHDFVISGRGAVAKPDTSRETETSRDNND
ncbi:hypothetical protein [Spiribacter roseus]|uniref:hypothetical protein n=1 Tax=Spiribacter roseus TaxID=1855875 RepID=UPI0013310BC1|nr:hypothetical protein [Spiribacter roseus]